MVAEAIERFGLGALRNKVDRGVWQKPCRGVVVLHNGTLTHDQQLAVALASAASGSAIAGLTALAYDGFTGFTHPQRQLVLPSGARKPSRKGLSLHWSTQLDERDVHPLHLPRRTRPARSLVDAASWTKNPRLARAIVIAGVQQGLANVRGLREAPHDAARAGTGHSSSSRSSMHRAVFSRFPSATSARSATGSGCLDRPGSSASRDRTERTTLTPRGSSSACPRRCMGSHTTQSNGGVPTWNEPMRS